MNVRRLVVILMLLLAGTAQAQQPDVSEFTGKWSNTRNALWIESTKDGIICTIKIGENDTLRTKYVAVIDSCIYIDFFVIDDYSKANHIIYACTLKHGKLETSIHVMSEICNSFDRRLFSSRKSKTETFERYCNDKKRNKTSNSEALKLQVVRDSKFFNGLSSDSVKIYVDRQFDLLKHLYDNHTEDVFVFDTAGFFPHYNWMQEFVIFSNAISVLENAHSSFGYNIDLLTDYMYCLGNRADIWQFYLADTNQCLRDMEKLVAAAPVSYIKDIFINDLWRLTRLYIYSLNSADTFEDSVVIAEKAVQTFEKIGLLPEDITMDLAHQLVDIPFCYNLIGRECPLDKIINDSIAQYFFLNSNRLYLGNIGIAVSVMGYLVGEGRYKDALDFYDSIKQNFCCNDRLNSLYVHALISEGYYDEDMSDIVMRSRTTAPGEDYYRELQTALAWMQVAQGDELNATENISGNEARFGELLDSSQFSLSQVYEYLAFLYYQKKDYRKTYDYIQAYLDLESDSSSRILIKSICLSRMAEKDSLRGNIQKSLAKQGFLSVIEYETRHDSIGSMPYAYIELGMKDEAVKAVEKNLKKRGVNADNEDYLLAAEIYAQAGQKRKAISAIEKMFELCDTSLIQTYVQWCHNGPYLEPIRNEVLEFCTKYGTNAPVVYHSRFFDTVSSTIPFVASSQNGAMYVRCRMGNIEVDSLVFDTGADIVLISRELQEKLLFERAIPLEGYMGRLTINGADDNPIPGDVYRIPVFYIGDIELHNIHVFVPDAPYKVTLLLGKNVFGDMTVTINPRKSQLTLTRITEKRIEQKQ